MDSDGMDSIEVESEYFMQSKQMSDSISEKKNITILSLYFLITLLYFGLALFSPQFHVHDESVIPISESDLSTPISFFYSVHDINNKNINFNQWASVQWNTKKEQPAKVKLYIKQYINTTNHKYSNNFTNKYNNSLYDGDTQIFELKFTNKSNNSILTPIFQYHSNDADSLSMHYDILVKDENIKKLIFISEYNNPAALTFQKTLQFFLSLSILISLISNLINSHFGIDQFAVMSCVVIGTLGFVSTFPLGIFSKRFEIITPYIFSIFKLLFHILSVIKFSSNVIQYHEIIVWISVVFSLVFSTINEMSFISNHSFDQANNFENLPDTVKSSNLSLVKEISSFLPVIVILSMIFKTIKSFKSNIIMNVGQFMIISLTPASITLLSHHVSTYFDFMSNKGAFDILHITSYIFSGIMFIILQTYIAIK
ncbi:hypothetical protein TRFO_39250 [Tritrichomonas foetus]|uniref:Uncharacterized protein n=1 Tax=Tritrichomonas foetus TaxID=1144522 RepID=A0A1J4J5M8_9EUKA|nr:hypothetical protein TRFO_39250 [Tritrichomonas foetus]|eukprot:OHS94560.1 hypothetical protein TRFO_39250 [Tritrichomonas foetus]